MKTKIYLLLTVFLTCVVSCDEDLAITELNNEEIAEIVEPGINFEYALDEEGTLFFEDETALASNLDNKSYKEIRTDVRELRKQGFVPLNPMFDENENNQEEAYLKRRLQKAAKNGYFYTNKIYDKDFADLEDDVIGDPKFAAMLNEDREVIVGKKFYKYTPYGLFFCKKKDKKYLKSYLKELSSSKTGKSTASKLAAKCENFQKSGSYTGKNENIVAIDNKISLYSSCGGGGGPITIGGGGSGGSSNSGTATFPFEFKNSLPTCRIDQESVWQKVFGPAETCEDYFDSKRRVKVKFWSQSYLVYASVGTSTKFQKKYWLGWQTSNAVDYTELGINHASFTYKKNVSGFDKIFKDIQNDVLIRWKNTVWTGDGRRLTNIPFSMPKWPFESGDFDKFAFEVYINKDINFEYDSKDAYKDILKVTKGIIKTYGKKFDGLFEEAQKDNVVMKGVAFVKNADKFIVTVNERHERDYNDCCASYVLDRNFLIDIKYGWSKGNFQVEKQPTGAFVSSGNGADQTVTYVGHETARWSAPIPVPKFGVFNATKYTDFSIDFYGVSRRDGKKYRGSRMVGSGK